MSDFRAWLDGKERGSVAILTGGSSGAVLTSILQLLTTRAVVLADRTLTGSLLPLVALRPGPRIEVRLSRGLARDLAAVTESASTGPLIVAGDTLENEARGEVQRAFDQLLVLAGYPTPPSIIAAHVAHRLAVEIARYSERSLAPLVVHDRLSLLPVQGLPRAKVFAAGATIDTSGGKGDDHSHGGLTARIDSQFRPPAQAELLQHAEYLVKTELAVLVDMHRWLAGPVLGDILMYWATQIATVAGTQGHELFVTFAGEKLGELADVLSSGPRA